MTSQGLCALNAEINNSTAGSAAHPSFGPHAAVYLQWFSWPSKLAQTPQESAFAVSLPCISRGARQPAGECDLRQAPAVRTLRRKWIHVS